MELKELIIHATHESFPAIENILSEIGALGVSKEVFQKDKQLIIKGYFEDDKLGKEKIKVIKDKIFALSNYGLNIDPIDMRVKALKQEDWANKWKEDIKAIKVSDRIVIKPTWEEYHADDGDIIIEIDPGMAFGTGDHGTTSGCLEMLEKYLKPNFNVLDIGTGTGILAIAAAKLGANSLFALDIDPVAIEVAKENAKLNGVNTEIEFSEGDLLDVVEGRYELILANILPHVIMRLIPDLVEVSKDKSTIILSGIIEEKVEKIKEELIRYNFDIQDIVKKDQWITIVVTRRG
ncbi:50S ribosomal protein L11 methyltransferase [Orenia marismortui]|uniref:50S ribosomal protein L11 methyltransferase n=1 Tax=Orenia marismortui TaxID=46469 RepID=UPI0003746C62|nr:50S ribosomal protein L11 methyltransferase [Orenia marismortui]